MSTAKSTAVIFGGVFQSFVWIAFIPCPPEHRVPRDRVSSPLGVCDVRSPQQMDVSCTPFPIPEGCYTVVQAEDQLVGVVPAVCKHDVPVVIMATSTKPNKVAQGVAHTPHLSGKASSQDLPSLAASLPGTNAGMFTTTAAEDLSMACRGSPRVVESEGAEVGSLIDDASCMSASCTSSQRKQPEVESSAGSKKAPASCMRPDKMEGMFCTSVPQHPGLDLCVTLGGAEGSHLGSSPRHTNLSGCMAPGEAESLQCGIAACSAGSIPSRRDTGQRNSAHGAGSTQPSCSVHMPEKRHISEGPKCHSTRSRGLVQGDDSREPVSLPTLCCTTAKGQPPSIEDDGSSCLHVDGVRKVVFMPSRRALRAQSKESRNQLRLQEQRARSEGEGARGPENPQAAEMVLTRKGEALTLGLSRSPQRRRASKGSIHGDGDTENVIISSLSLQAMGGCVVRHALADGERASMLSESASHMRGGGGGLGIATECSNRCSDGTGHDDGCLHALRSDSNQEDRLMHCFSEHAIQDGSHRMQVRCMPSLPFPGQAGTTAQQLMPRPLMSASGQGLSENRSVQLVAPRRSGAEDTMSACAADCDAQSATQVQGVPGHCTNEAVAFTQSGAELDLNAHPEESGARLNRAKDDARQTRPSHNASSVATQMSPGSHDLLRAPPQERFASPSKAEPLSENKETPAESAMTFSFQGALPQAAVATGEMSDVGARQGGEDVCPCLLPHAHNVTGDDGEAHEGAAGNASVRGHIRSGTCDDVKPEGVELSGVQPPPRAHPTGSGTSPCTSGTSNPLSRAVPVNHPCGPVALRPHGLQPTVLGSKCHEQQSRVSPGLSGGMPSMGWTSLGRMKQLARIEGPQSNLVCLRSDGPRSRQAQCCNADRSPLRQSIVTPPIPTTSSVDRPQVQDMLHHTPGLACMLQVEKATHSKSRLAKARLDECLQGTSHDVNIQRPGRLRTRMDIRKLLLHDITLDRLKSQSESAALHSIPRVSIPVQPYNTKPVQSSGPEAAVSPSPSGSPVICRNFTPQDKSSQMHQQSSQHDTPTGPVATSATSFTPLQPSRARTQNKNDTPTCTGAIRATSQKLPEAPPRRVRANCESLPGQSAGIAAIAARYGIGKRFAEHFVTQRRSLSAAAAECMHAAPCTVAAAKDNGVISAAAAYACCLLGSAVHAEFTGLGLRRLPDLSVAAAHLQSIAASFNKLAAVPVLPMGHLRRLDLCANCIQNIPDSIDGLMPRLEVCTQKDTSSLRAHQPENWHLYYLAEIYWYSLSALPYLASSRHTAALSLLLWLGNI
jgi:hypothetical protein